MGLMAIPAQPQHAKVNAQPSPSFAAARQSTHDEADICNANQYPLSPYAQDA
jgi:hypothetical protein